MLYGLNMRRVGPVQFQNNAVVHVAVFAVEFVVRSTPHPQV